MTDFVAEVGADSFARSALDPSETNRVVTMIDLYGLAILEGAFQNDRIESLAPAIHSIVDARKCTPDASAGLKVGDKRYLMTLPLESPFGDDCVYANPFLYPVLFKLLGHRMILGSFGAVLAFPGAPAQHIHRDHPRLFGGHQVERIIPAYAITVIIPLVALNEETGTTMMWIGSHRSPRVMRKHCQPVLPYPRIGGAILMDGRMEHAGTPNTSSVIRPILYFEYMRPWFRDCVNYRTQAALQLPPGFLTTVSSAHRHLFDPYGGAEQDSESE